MKYSVTADPKQLANIEAALKIVDPQAVLADDGSGLKIIVEANPDFLVKVVIPELPVPSWEYQDQEIFDQRYSESDRRQRLKELVRLGIIKVLGRFLQQNPPWGSLSAVRPTKIFHYLREKGFSIAETGARLSSIYGISPQKVDLLLQVGGFQEKYLKCDNRIGLYIGVPFCPTRCHYCSFAAVSLESHQHEVKPFLASLAEEMRAMVELIVERQLVVESIYIGGGTPTSLDEEQLARLVTDVHRYFFTDATVEFTVEAGRPETISRDKLIAMVNHNVTRVSVNPQSMHDKTLAVIGRRHSVSDIYQAVGLVKEFPQLTLNMDLILGLPGENSRTFLNSLRKVADLQPENITIHTLAPKHAAHWRKEFSELDLAEPSDLVKGAEQGEAYLATLGYHPYYLYRQRQILAELQNIGFTLPGHASVFNIQMMEERQTILAMGGGAVTKWVVGKEHLVYRHQNPKCPATYVHRIKDEIVKKVQQTRLLLG